MKGLVVFFAAIGVAASARAQIPSEPVTLGGGRVVIGGDVALAAAPEDRGFFNYSDYEQTTLRQFRIGLTGLVRVTDRISFVGELRSENFDRVAPFALYARVRPLPGRRLDIQIGRIPPTFGAFSRRAYAHDNPLVGSPLAYQYLTSLRADTVPGDADELLRMRGRGWLSSFTFGSLEPAHGVPLVSASTWDTGVQVTGGWKILTATAALTNGTASNPRVSDDNAGKQFSARLEATPVIGLVLGGSFARGEFLSRRVRALLPDTAGRRYPQIAHGVDLEYSRGHWMVRGEAVLSEWRIPIPSRGPAPVSLRAAAGSVEGRYTFAPGMYAAARVGHLAFNRITGAALRDEWDAPVTRVEVGGGYYVRRNVVARLALQFNARDGGRVRSARYLTGQLLYWF